MPTIPDTVVVTLGGVRTVLTVIAAEPQVAAPAGIRVSDIAGLTAALKNAKDGETVRLAPGTYTGLTYKAAPTHGVAITVTSDDPSNPAVITDFLLRYAKGIRFTDLIFQALPHPELADPAKAFAFKFQDSSDIHLERVTVRGQVDGDAGNDASGAGFRNVDNLSVVDCEFQSLARGLAIGPANKVVVTGNNFHDLRSDGVDFAQVSDVVLALNTFRNFRPLGTDHPDAIQFWTSGTTTASRDILIEGNLIERGEGAYTQAIFLRDQVGTMPYERVTVRNNLIIGTGYNAIRFQGVKGLTLTGNELVSFKGDNQTGVLIQGADGVVSTGNRSIGISYDKSVNVTESGNIKTPAVADGGAAAMATWKARAR